MLPEGQYTLPESITVKAGQYATDALSIALKSFSQEMMKSGESYALPVNLCYKMVVYSQRKIPEHLLFWQKVLLNFQPRCS